MDTKIKIPKRQEEAILEVDEEEWEPAKVPASKISKSYFFLGGPNRNTSRGFLTEIDLLREH